jgi:DNA polymerase-4
MALRKCPELVLAKPDFKLYVQNSRAFIAICKKYAPVVEQVSIDECFCDFDNTELVYPDPLELAYRIKDEIKESLGFTVNVGISENKLLAKMASDFEKPDKVHTLYPGEILEKMWPLPIGSLYGCGGVSAERLRSFGIRTIGDAAAADVTILQAILGEKAGAYISRAAKGISRSRVSDEREAARSYSNETTTKNDITADNYTQDLPPIVRQLSDKVSGRLKKDGVFGTVVNVQVKTSEFKRYSRQMKLDESTDNADDIYGHAMALLMQLLDGESGLFSSGKKIRLVGVGVDHLDKGEYRQENLFDWMTKGKEELKLKKQKKEKEDKLDIMEKSLREKYGESIIHKGIT